LAVSTGALSAAIADVLWHSVLVTEADERDLVLGVSRSLLQHGWSWPVHGLRHPPEASTSGWYIWTGDLSSAPDFFVPLHARHLVERLPEVAAYLSLPPGSRFLIAPGHEDVWIDESLLDIGR
jgi:hypothetical protein